MEVLYAIFCCSLSSELGVCHYSIYELPINVLITDSFLRMERFSVHAVSASDVFDNFQILRSSFIEPFLMCSSQISPFARSVPLKIYTEEMKKRRINIRASQEWFKFIINIRQLTFLRCVFVAS